MRVHNKLKDMKMNSIYVGILSNGLYGLDDLYNSFNCENKKEFLNIIDKNYEMNGTLFLIIDNAHKLFKDISTEEKKNEIKYFFNSIVQCVNEEKIGLILVSDYSGLTNEIYDCGKTFFGRLSFIQLNKNERKFKQFIEQFYPQLSHISEEIIKLIGINFRLLGTINDMHGEMSLKEIEKNLFKMISERKTKILASNVKSLNQNSFEKIKICPSILWNKPNEDKCYISPSEYDILENSGFLKNENGNYDFYDSLTEKYFKNERISSTKI